MADIDINIEKPSQKSVEIEKGGVAFANWGGIKGDIHDQKDLLQLISESITPSSDKEVYTVLTASTTAPSSASADDLYINTSDNKLYKYTSGEWVEDSDDITTDAVYIAEDTGHVWTYNGTAFVDSGGSTVDNVIYVDNLNTNDDLNSCITPGVYTVCYKKTNTKEWLSLVVQVSRLNHNTVLNIIQYLSNRNGYRYRSRLDVIEGSGVIGTWSAWGIKTYAYEKDLYKGVPVVSQSGNATVSPNVWNVWQSVATDLTITKGNDISGIVNEYIIRLTLDSSWVEGTNTITFNGFALEWNGGSVPTWTAGHIYEISIVDNIALWADITPAS